MHSSGGLIVTYLIEVNNVLSKALPPLASLLHLGSHKGIFLPTVVDNPVALFADDPKCGKVICKIDDCHELQDDLLCLQEWSQAWRLSFNSTKCEVLTVSRKRSPISYDYKIGSQSLVRVTSQKDLGVIVTKDLKWNAHVDNTVAKAFKMLGFLRRHTCKSFDGDTRRLYFC